MNTLSRCHLPPAWGRRWKESGKRWYSHAAWEVFSAGNRNLLNDGGVFTTSPSPEMIFIGSSHAPPLNLTEPGHRPERHSTLRLVQDHVILLQTLGEDAGSRVRRASRVVSLPGAR
ncbi:hypothetical protein GCM10010510_58740 [Streptomyces anandii JCM 4720]|nr:hypothetical protein GCM10010510_58740 [Streptomyces anandii JCM 4720]